MLDGRFSHQHPTALPSCLHLETQRMNRQLQTAAFELFHVYPEPI